MTTKIEKLYDVPQAAEVLGSSEKFIRRLIAERRIAFVRMGRCIRITESALSGYITAQTVQPIDRRRSGRWAA